MPNRFQMAKNFTKSMAKTAKAVVEGKEVVAKSELYSKRTSICRSCPWFSEKGDRVQKCGFVIPLKAYFAQEKCTVGKWLKSCIEHLKSIECIESLKYILFN